MIIILIKLIKYNMIIKLCILNNLKFVLYKIPKQNKIFII
jgi:hypothetical protein